MNESTLKLSVIIASVNGMPILGECLESLGQQSAVKEPEVVVANRCTNDVGMILNQKYPWVKVIEAPSNRTVPQLRALSFQEASGDVLAVLEDHCIVEPDWAQRIIESHQAEYPVIGGSVENAACERLVDWAAFFCEYSEAMKPVPEGEVQSIPGNSVSYKKWVLERFKRDIDSGVWDFMLHEHMKDAGLPLYSIPSITVHHKMSASLGWFITQKFHFARSFAGVRLTGASWYRHALYGAGTVLLPFVLAARIVSIVWKKKRHRRELLLCFPILIFLLLSWGLGEAVGYVFGAGSSSSKVA